MQKVSTNKIYRYTQDDVFEALIAVIERSARFSIENVNWGDPRTATIVARLNWALLGYETAASVSATNDGKAMLVLESEYDRFNMTLIGDMGQTRRDHSRIYEMVEVELHAYQAVDEVAPAPAASGSGEPDIFEQIKKLAELRDSGILTTQEFETKKKSLLDKL